jgi:hypothetical protein
MSGIQVFLEMPKQVEFRAALPKSAVGKVLLLTFYPSVIPLYPTAFPQQDAGALRARQRCKVVRWGCPKIAS